MISLPLALPGVVTGSILAFAKAIGEFGATITFVSNIPGETRTLPSAVYSFMQVPGGEESAYRLVVLAIVISMTALLLSEWLAKRVKTVVEGR
jgi:molybdate transport system permease protein